MRPVLPWAGRLLTTSWGSGQCLGAYRWWLHRPRLTRHRADGGFQQQLSAFDGGQGCPGGGALDSLKVTASLLYQNVYNHDRDQYWANLSNPSNDQFAQASRTRQPAKDEFYLPALKVQYDLEKMSFVSNTSYFYHRDWAALDYTTYFAGIFDGNPLQYLPGEHRPRPSSRTGRMLSLKRRGCSRAIRPL